MRWGAFIFYAAFVAIAVAVAVLFIPETKVCFSPPPKAPRDLPAFLKYMALQECAGQGPQ